MSLQAKAAQLGLAEMTVDLRAEIAAFTPRTPDEAKRERIEELIAAQPYGAQGYYNESGDFVPGAQGNMTAALELEALAPERAAALKLQAQPPKPAEGALSAEGAEFINARLASLSNIAGAAQ